MAEKLYNAFKLQMHERVGGGPGFFAITEMKLFSDKNGLGNQVLTGGVASSSTSYGVGYEAKEAFDLDLTTRWASASNSATAFIQYVLTTAVPKPKSIYFILNNSPENAPVSFTLLASSDNGATWEDIFTSSSFATASEFNNGVTKNLINIGLRGIALDSNGLPVHRIMVYDWFNGSYLGTATPNSLGNWAFVLATNTAESRYLVVATDNINASNIRPQAHGPVIAKELS